MGIKHRALVLTLETADFSALFRPDGQKHTQKSPAFHTLTVEPS